MKNENTKLNNSDAERFSSMGDNIVLEKDNKHGAEDPKTKDMRDYTMADLKDLVKASVQLWDPQLATKATPEDTALNAISRAAYNLNLRIPSSVDPQIVEEVLKSVKTVKKANHTITQNELSQSDNVLRIAPIKSKLRMLYLEIEKHLGNNSVAIFKDQLDKLLGGEPNFNGDSEMDETEKQNANEGEGVPMKKNAFAIMARIASLEAEGYQKLAEAEELRRSAGVADVECNVEQTVHNASKTEDVQEGEEVAAFTSAGDKTASITLLSRIASELSASGESNRIALAAELDSIASVLKSAKVIEAPTGDAVIGKEVKFEPNKVVENGLESAEITKTLGNDPTAAMNNKSIL